MKILVIGGTSSLGNALKPVLSEFSEVVTAGRKDCDITLDISEPMEKISIPFNIDTVIHMAANFVDTTPQEILQTETVNALGTLKLCLAAAQAKVKHFILISSMSACLKENSEYYSLYSLSKKHSEELASFICTKLFLPLTILRPSQIYGNEESFKKHQPFIYSMINKAESGEDITIYGSHDALRNYIHVDDLTKIISKVVQNKIEGIYSCMYSSNVTYSQIAKAALSAFKSKAKIRFLKNKPNIPDNIFEKDNSLYEKIEFYPQISIEEGMKKIALYRSSCL